MGGAREIAACQEPVNLWCKIVELTRNCGRHEFPTMVQVDQRNLS